MFEKCTNKSSPPSSGVMKPNPFFASNHFTLPLLTALLLCSPRTAIHQTRQPRERVSLWGKEAHSLTKSSQLYLCQSAPVKKNRRKIPAICLAKRVTLGPGPLQPDGTW